MTELQTRSEHSRSMADAERFQAISSLTELGLFIPITELETFHGRLGTDDPNEAWRVDPAFANGGDDSGNGNVNARPTLYTADEETAKEFAKARLSDEKYDGYMDGFEERVRSYTPEEKRQWLERLNEKVAENRTEEVDEKKTWRGRTEDYTEEELSGAYAIGLEARRLERETPDEERNQHWREAIKGSGAWTYEIASMDPDAVVIDFRFDVTKLGEDEKKAYGAAVKALAIPITEGSPVDFEQRGEVEKFVAGVNQLKKNILLPEHIAELSEKTGVNEDLALHLASSYNARRLIRTRPAFMAHLLIENKDGITNANIQVDGERQDVPINLEYAERYFRMAHVVGVKQSVSSATLGRGLDSVSFFDLEKVDTVEAIEEGRTEIVRKLGSIAAEFKSPVTFEDAYGQSELVKLLQDPHAKPQALVAAARQIEGYDEIFGADAGNWEGFTLNEHTETVLRNFDENFADKVPIELVAPIQLMLLGHDLGKPEAVARGEKRNEKERNLAQAADFFGKVGVSEKTAEFLLSIIGDGSNLAFQVFVQGRESENMDELQDLARRSITQLDGKEATPDQIDGYIALCKLLLTCDGGAYTSMATTRRDVGGRYRNAPSFNHSFARPVGFGKRGLRLAVGSEERAPQNLTPRINPNQSNLRISRRGAGRKPPSI